MTMTTFGVTESLVLIIVVAIAVVIPAILCCVIAKKAGFSKWWGILAVVPLVSLFAIWYFAFADWPRAAYPRG